VPVWGFVFVLAAAIVFAMGFIAARTGAPLGWCLLSIGIILTFATTTSPVHF
jgi:hypothetical protein